MAKKKAKSQQKQQKKFSEKDYMLTRMRSLPIGKCYISPDDDKASEVTVFVTREHPAGTVSVGMYMIDKYCVGVKDATYMFSIDTDEAQDILDHHKHKVGLKEVPYVEAHNLIYGALEYAESIGIPPHKDFETAQYILAEDNDDIPLIEYQFGKDGRPTLMCNSALEIDHYKKLMLKKLQPDEFDVIYLSNAPSNDEGFEDINDNPYEDEWEEVSKEEYINEDLNLSLLDRTSEIQSLDTVRKVAFFIIAAAFARRAKAVDASIATFVKSADQALLAYRKYGDIAFGEATSLLHDAVIWILDFDNTAKVTTATADESDALFHLCMAYNHGAKEMHLSQSDYLRNAIDDTDRGEKMLLDDFDQVIHNITSMVSELIKQRDVSGQEPVIPFRVSGFRQLKWNKPKVRTRAKGPKLGFVSKDPGNYYRRKIREVIDTRFVDADDFMGGIITLNNLSMSAIDLINDDHGESALFLLFSIVIETGWSIYDGQLDKWIDDKDLRENMKVMLSNAVIIFANMILKGEVPNRSVGIINSECNRLALAMPGKYADIMDLHPLIYSAETIMYGDNE